MPCSTPNSISRGENRLTSIWWQTAGKEFVSEDGESIRVVYPGRSNGDRGPDFVDAVVLFGSKLVRGDVEIHASAGDWYTHGHHLDDKYSNVVLHVAMGTRGGASTFTKDGRAVPVVCLGSRERSQCISAPGKLSCSGLSNSEDKGTLTKLLSAAGEKRFRQKAIHFTARLRQEQPGQVLFAGIMRALGYAKNTKPFEHLAQKMPLDYLECQEGLSLKQALLLGSAGLLPSQRQRPDSAAEEEAQELEAIWQSSGKHTTTLKQTDWNLSHIYPNNFPVRRIVALSWLLERYRQQKLLTSVLELVKEAALRGGHRVLEAGFTVTGDGYWQAHFDFGQQSKTNPSALLGNSKAREIIVNIVLPFVSSWAELMGQPRLREATLQLYRSYPRLAQNYLTRHMFKQLQLGHHSGLTACHQQGLIHIFRNYCREGKCRICPLAGRARLSDFGSRDLKIVES